MERGGCVYIMTNKFRTTLYIGVTSDLQKRVYEHVHHVYPQSFTAKNKCEICIYYESFFSIEEAILREKELKGWKRLRKEDLINKMNPQWEDLWNDIKNW